jgi:hypothetical protein
LGLESDSYLQRCLDTAIIKKAFLLALNPETLWGTSYSSKIEIGLLKKLAAFETAFVCMVGDYLYSRPIGIQTSSLNCAQKLESFFKYLNFSSKNNIAVQCSAIIYQDRLLLLNHQTKADVVVTNPDYQVTEDMILKKAVINDTVQVMMGLNKGLKIYQTMNNY